MQQLIERFNHQLRESIEIGHQMQFVPADREIRNVVIAASGSSGVGAALVGSWAFDQIAVPVITIKSYDTPTFVNEHTLFIACSFSGDTEETLSAVEQAVAKNAIIVCVAAGGKLLQIGEEHGYTTAQLPDTFRDTNTFLVYTFIQLLFLLKNYGLIDDSFISQVEKATVLIDEREKVMREGACDLAKALTGRLPVLYADARLHPVLVHFQQQMNEKAKQIAHVNVFPEMNHNELAGWVNPAELIDKTVVVMVQTGYDHPRVRRRMDICRPVFSQKADKVVEISVRYGDSFMEQCLYLIHLFDWAAFYLAEQNETDAQESSVMDYLQQELAKG